MIWNSKAIMLVIMSHGESILRGRLIGWALALFEKLNKLCGSIQIRVSRIESDYLTSFRNREIIMSKREPVCDVRASADYLLSKTGFGKIQKLRRFEKYRDLRRFKIKAYKSAFLRELVPLLTTDIPAKMWVGLCYEIKRVRLVTVVACFYV